MVGVFQTLIVLAGIFWVTSGAFFSRHRSKVWVQGLFAIAVISGMGLAAFTYLMPNSIASSEESDRSSIPTAPENRLAEILQWKAPSEDSSSDPATRRAIENVYYSEELIIQLASDIGHLSKSAQNLRFPDQAAQDVFLKNAKISGDVKSQVSPQPWPDSDLSENETVASSIRSTHWTVEAGPLEMGDFLWTDYFQNIKYFDYAKFFFVKAKFEPLRESWIAEIGFKGLAKTYDGHWQTVKARIETSWLQDDAAKEVVEGWKIASWKTCEFKTESIEKRMFRNVNSSALPDPQTRERAERSIHEEHVIDLVLQGAEFKPPHQPFRYEAFERHPGVSVVDVNQDGFDDIYLMARIGTNQLFLNQRDGTFREAAKEFGLDITNHCTCAVFFDPDNDGDLDVFIGRTLEPSKYLINENGVYGEPERSKFLGGMPRDVSSVAAADYDNDGLVDLYVSTYDPIYAPNANRRNRANQSGQRRSQARRSSDFLDKTGPPNELLHNVGDGKFQRVRQTPLAIERLTFQSGWCDYDNDGDQDLFCANDFGPDYLFENEGNGKFKDVTHEEGLELVVASLSMGIAWGDYNNDETMDLYVSGMYSKAGKRVMGGIEGEDPRLLKSAEGSTLFSQSNSKFQPMLTGAERKAGWSWGGQFVDIDNDADQDIYITSGYYTAPAGLARPGDG